jgi:hypothetical protein
VKNTNIEMALAALTTGTLPGDEAGYEAGVQAARSQFIEINDHQNYGYRSWWDGGRTNWDGHNAFEAVWLKRAGEILGREDYVESAEQQYRAIHPELDDGARMYAACHFADEVPEAKQLCEEKVESGWSTGITTLGLVL